MKAFILLLLIAMPTFSQKLWEIDVTGNGNLTDVREIPNSELLLFTYNTGRLEIRCGSDGSFVNQLISKPGESDGPVISSTGTLYYYRSAADTIEFRDIITNEPVIRVSPQIEELEANPVFDTKPFMYFELFDNNTKIVGNMIYKDKDDSRNNRPNYIIYNLVTKQIEYTRPSHTSDVYYSTIKKSYLSPDEKYIIEISAVKPRARMFNLQTREYEFEFDEDKGDLRPTGEFISDNIMAFLVSTTRISLFNFPQITLIKSIDIPQEYGIRIASSRGGYHFCGDELFINAYKRIEGGNANDFEFWHVKLNLNNLNIVYNSYNQYWFYEGSRSYVIDNCSKIIIDKDFDNRNGIIACYDYSALNVSPQNPNQSYFSNTDSTINFHSSEFTGQNARIEIYDSVGNKVAMLYSGVISQNNYQFNLPDLPSGAYHLQCQLNSTSLNFNFMVVR